MSFIPSPDPESHEAGIFPASAFITAGRSLRAFPLHPHFGWAILWCIALLLLTQVPGVIAAVAYIVIVLIAFPNLIDPNQLKNFTEMLQNTHVQVGMGIALWVAHFLIILCSLAMLRVVVGRDWPRQVALRLPSLPHFGLIVVMTPAIIVLANGLFILLRDVLHLPSFIDPKQVDGAIEMDKLFNSWPLLIAISLIGVMPALSEELWCRAFLGRGLVGIHGYVLGVLMASFCFGVIHIDPCQGTMAAIIGIALHYLYLTTRSLVAPMLLHFFNNATSVILVRIPGDFAPNESVQPYYYFAAGLVLVAVGLALYESRARLVATDGGIPWRPAYPGVACPPPGSNTIVVAPMPSLLSVFMVLLSLGAFGAALAAAIR